MWTTVLSLTLVLRGFRHLGLGCRAPASGPGAPAESGRGHQNKAANRLRGANGPKRSSAQHFICRSEPNRRGELVRSG